MNNPTNPRRTFLIGLIPTLVIASSIAWAGPVYTIQDGGMPRQFEVTDDEVFMSRTTAGIAVEVKSTFAAAEVVRDYGKRAVVRFPQADWRKAVGPRAVGGAKFEQVAYPQGSSRTDATRRIITSDVLASGADQAELIRISGAQSAKAVRVPGYFMLSFASSAEALTGTEKLRKGGLSAEPQLRSTMSRMAAPNDSFFNNQWHLLNTGAGGGLPGVDANILLAWGDQPPGAPAVPSYTGAGVTISIVDDSLELRHEDLEDNVVLGDVHFDFNDKDNDPNPELGDNHGTAVAGVAAARGGNNQGVTGGGPEAALVGLRLISGPQTDRDFADAFEWSGSVDQSVDIDICSNSWGPSGGFGLVLGPDVLARAALQSAARNGRDGKGRILVFAAGNGRETEDQVNMNGFANSRYSIAVGAIADNGLQSYYSNNGSSLLISAPSNGGVQGIFTTDVTAFGGYNNGFNPGEPADRDYTNSFGGTSSATPLVSGIISLMLEANPALGYRDVMEIIASTAFKIDATNGGWRENAAGFLFHHGYGAGMIDAAAAIIRSVDWVNLPAETVSERVLAIPAAIVIPDGSAAGLARTFDFSTETIRVEHVEVQLDIEHAHRSDLQITLRSPSGHVSRLIEKRARRDQDKDYTDGGNGWIFSSTQHWGEDGAGVWTVTISDLTAGTAGKLRKARVRLCGTPATDKSRFTFDKRIDMVPESAPESVVNVRRLGSTAGEATVDYYISDRASATPGGDFSPRQGTLTFADGEAVKSFTIPIVDDIGIESDERFYVVLRNPSVGTLGGITVQTIEIQDDESNAVKVTAIDATAYEKNLATEAADTGKFRISRTLPSPQPLRVNYTFTNPPDEPVLGSPHYAQHIVDFNELPLTAVIPANETFVDVEISPKNDRLSEGTEIVELSIAPALTYNLGLPSKAAVNLVDNELVPVQVSASPSSVVESETNKIVFTIVRDTNQLDDQMNVYLKATGTAIGGIDYDPPLNGTVVTIPPGKASATISIQANDNSTYNEAKTLILAVSQGLESEYKEGFFRSVEVRIFDDEPLPDSVKPTVEIIAPLKEARINSPDTITVTGKALDNADSLGNTNAAQVRYRLNSGDWNAATLTNTDWSANITSLASLGNNVLDAYSIDEDGNESKISTVKFVYVKERSITATVVGNGTLPANVVGTHTYEVGQSYTLVARPNSSTNLFNGWSGFYNSTDKTLTFSMPDEDISLTATFSSALIDSSVVGKFAGLITKQSSARGIAEFDSASSGFFGATITKSGNMSGALNYGGVKFSVRGTLTGDGRYIGQIARKNNSPIALSLVLDVNTAGSHTLSGTVSVDGVVSSVNCPKILTPAEAATATAGIAGKFTFQIPMEDRVSQINPQGTGVGTITLSSKGAIRWTGILPDGSPATQAANISKGKTWPLFVSNFKGRGMMLGTVQHDSTQTLTDLTASLDWKKVGDPKDEMFPNGFTITSAQMTGSAYVAPDKGQRVLSSFASANGTLILEAGNFATPMSAKSISITEQNKVNLAPIAADALGFRISTASGGLSGEFVHPVTGKKIKVAGVVLQKSQKGAGIFNGSTFTKTAIQTGRMSFSIPPQ